MSISLSKPIGSGFRRWLAAGTAAAVGVILPMATSHAESTEEGGFVGIGTADGGRLQLTVPAFAVVEDVIDGGGPVSQSMVDSFSSTGFAALPYPGEVAIAGPALFQTVTGQPFPGAYPFYVRATHPTTPAAELKDPSSAYALLAHATDGRADSMAQLRGQGGEGQNGGGGGATAKTSSVADGGRIVATAETINEAVNAGGGALRIASVRSRSVTSYAVGDRAPVTKTEFAVDGGAAGGYTFGVGPQGLVVAQQGIPVPRSRGLDQLNQALAPTGISLRLAAGDEVAGGGMASALEITVQRASPAPGVPASIVRLRLGGASTSVVVGGKSFMAPATPPTDSVSSAPGPASGPAPTAALPPMAPLGADATPASATGADGTGVPADVAVEFQAGGPLEAGFDTGSGTGLGQISEELVSGTPTTGPPDVAPAAVMLASPVSRPSLRTGHGSSPFAVLSIAGALILGLAVQWHKRGVLR